NAATGSPMCAPPSNQSPTLRSSDTAPPDNTRFPSSACAGWSPMPAQAELGNLVLRSEEHTSELQSLTNLVCRLLLEKKNTEHYSLCKHDFESHVFSSLGPTGTLIMDAGHGASDRPTAWLIRRSGFACQQRHGGSVSR